MQSVLQLSNLKNVVTICFSLFFFLHVVTICCRNLLSKICQNVAQRVSLAVAHPFDEAFAPALAVFCGVRLRRAGAVVRRAPEQDPEHRHTKKLGREGRWTFAFQAVKQRFFTL